MHQTINFSRGVPDPASFPVDDMKVMADRALSKYGDQLLQYGPATGFLPLREFIARWFGRQVPEVMVGNGSLELFGFLCEACLRPGDVVFVESPTYDRALTILQKHGVEIVGIDVGVDGIDLAMFEAALRRHTPKLVYLIPDFQNPTGMCTPLAARQQIADWSAQHDFLIVEDGPYGFLRYTGRDIPTMVSLAPDRTVHLSSFTKLISPGLRVGFMLGNPAIIDAVSRVAESYYITPGYFSQGVIAEWCNGGLLDAQLTKLRGLYAPRLAALLEALDRHLPGRLVGRPEGGFFAAITLDAGMDEAELLGLARDAGVILSSGNAFFVHAPSHRFIRLPFCALPPDVIEEGVRRLASMVAATQARQPSWA
ncbi:aminotransferase-like domain-containing protein [Janthinobacterium agaricidamnosum]|uniref:Aminotransferase class I and II family protein n=1 Tax=Janthinobacterium agaricidamnosum NBRC 102515 = DSM 9628 TaxID=1349767 RepID=W0V109_9BURK|nr:PLP-dependent aminotransferase family protein [Janthinobacterium agaricidamnosum]CDG81556.1 aminotransferase class I and II family protein [Janthinobacterium agaricidamnosum NBRC 102515 = DSM 9628]